MKSFLVFMLLAFSLSASALTFLKGQVSSETFLYEVGNRNADSSAVVGTINILSVPANVYVKDVHAFVETPIAGTSAEVLGDGAATNGFLVDGFAGTAGFYSASGSLKGSFDGAKFYSSADTLDLVLTGTATAGKIRFLVEYEAF